MGEIHLQEYDYLTFELDIMVKVAQNVAKYPLHHITYVTAKFEVFRRRCIYKKIHYLTFDLDLGIKVTQNVAQYSLHYMTCVPAKFAVATPSNLGGDAFTRKYIF